MLKNMLAAGFQISRPIDMGKQIEVDTLIDKSTNGEKGGQNNDKGR